MMFAAVHESVIGTSRQLLQRDIMAAIGGIADMTWTSRKRRE
jgi:hypothetical protein